MAPEPAGPPPTFSEFVRSRAEALGFPRPVDLFNEASRLGLDARLSFSTLNNVWSGFAEAVPKGPSREAWAQLLRLEDDVTDLWLAIGASQPDMAGRLTAKTPRAVQAVRVPGIEILDRYPEATQALAVVASALVSMAERVQIDDE